MELCTKLGIENVAFEGDALAVVKAIKVIEEVFGHAMARLLRT